MDSSLHKKYALFFSNFGGWNCLTIEEIQNLAQEIPCHMEEEGRLIVVIMGRKCLWETLYFICKGNFSAAFRRRKKSPSLAQVEGVQVPTYYYSPSEIRAALLPYFAFSRQFPIGFAVPPSYLNPFWNRFPILKRISAFLEKRIQHWAFLSDFSDHYYLEMCRVNT
jgi:hypothetical protein